MMRLAAFALVAAAGCSAGTGTSTTASRCDDVPAALVQAIAGGLTLQGGGPLSRASAVRSSSFEKVWFVAAEIDGPGMEKSGNVGVWVTNDLSANGVIGAVDGLAREFSDWGVRSDVSRSDDGYQAARACLGA